MNKPNIYVTGVTSPGDDTFSNDIGTWNVTKIQRDADKGLFGKPWILPVEPAIEANATVTVDSDKINTFAFIPGVLMKPLLAVMEDGRAWLVDGHHRLRALHKLGAREFRCYVVPESLGAQYQVRYNGKRKPPFPQY